MRKGVVLTLVAIVLISWFALAAFCGEAGGPPTIKPSKPYRFALIVKTLDNPFWLEVKKGAEDAAKETGINLVVKSPSKEVDLALQLTMVEDSITKKMDAILLAPADSKAIIPAIEKANAANVPVVTVDTAADGGKVVSFIATDNPKAAEMAGEFVAEKIGKKGKVAVLVGVPGHQTARDRREGFLKVMAKYPGIKVVAERAADWEQAKALTATEDILRANSDIVAIFSGNDLMAAGAAQAIAEVNKTGKILNVTFDLGVGCKMLADGTLDAAITQFPYLMGNWGVKYAIAYLEGKPVDPRIDTGVDIVTKENMSKYCK